MGTQVPLPKRAQPPFSAHICCGQMARWIKMSLGRNVGLDSSDGVLDGDPAPSPPKKGHSPQFSAHVYCSQTAHVYCAQTAGWSKMPLGTKVGLGPDRIVLHGDPAPNFRPMSIVVKRLPISATAEHLYTFTCYCIVICKQSQCGPN